MSAYMSAYMSADMSTFVFPLCRLPSCMFAYMRLLISFCLHVCSQTALHVLTCNAYVFYGLLIFGCLYVGSHRSCGGINVGAHVLCEGAYMLLYVGAYM
jgi:hypothetical protein